jgi:hypothetical protein
VERDLVLPVKKICGNSTGRQDYLSMWHGACVAVASALRHTREKGAIAHDGSVAKKEADLLQWREKNERELHHEQPPPEAVQMAPLPGGYSAPVRSLVAALFASAPEISKQSCWHGDGVWIIPRSLVGESRQAPELEKGCRPHGKTTTDSWRLEDTSLTIKTGWR